jgi:hypothetical protein
VYFGSILQGYMDIRSGPDSNDDFGDFILYGIPHAQKSQKCPIKVNSFSTSLSPFFSQK